MPNIRFKSNEEIPEYYKSTTISDDVSASISLEEPLYYPQYEPYEKNTRVRETKQLEDPDIVFLASLLKKPVDPYSTKRGKERQLPWNEECQEECKTVCFNTSEPDCEVCFDDCLAKLARGYKRKNEKTSELKSSIEDEQRNPEFMEPINEIIGLLDSIGYPNTSYIKHKLVQIRYYNEHWEFYFVSITSILNDLITRYNSTRTFGLMKNRPRLYRRIDQLFKILDSKTSDLVTYNEQQIYNDLLSIKGGKTRKLKKRQKKYTVMNYTFKKGHRKIKTKKTTTKKSGCKTKTVKNK